MKTVYSQFLAIIVIALFTISSPLTLKTNDSASDIDEESGMFGLDNYQSKLRTTTRFGKIRKNACRITFEAAPYLIGVGLIACGTIALDSSEEEKNIAETALYSGWVIISCKGLLDVCRLLQLDS